MPCWHSLDATTREAAEALLEQTVADATATGGWHQWLWQLRLAQAKAELALARGVVDDAITIATEAIETSRARRRPKYEALAFMTRARSFHAAARTARGNSRCASGG